MVITSRGRDPSKFFVSPILFELYICCRMLNLLVFKMRKEDTVFSQKSALEDQSKSIFDPIIVLLFAFGIDVKNRAGESRKIDTFLASFFHLVWILVAVNAVACFDDTDITYHLFTAIKYLCALFSWWILYRKRNKLLHMRDFIAALQVSLKANIGSNLPKWIYFTSWFSVFIVFGPGIICCLKLLILDEYPLFFCPYHQRMMTQKVYARILHFWLLFAFNYISRGLPFVVTIFYSFYCIELKRLAKFLERKQKQKEVVPNLPDINKVLNNQNILTGDDYLHNGDTMNVYLSLVKLIMELENAFSSLVFLQFVNSFLEILRIETVVLMYMKGRWQFDIIIHSLYYSFVGASSFLAMILSADDVPSRFHATWIILRNDDDYFNERCLKSLKLQIEYLQDMRYTRLTAWGMFEVKRDLFLSIFALLISYGIIIAQITP